MVLSNLTERHLVSPDLKTTLDTSLKPNILLKQSFPQILEESEPNDSANSGASNQPNQSKTNSKAKILIQSVQIDNDEKQNSKAESLLRSIAESDLKFKGFESIVQSGKFRNEKLKEREETSNQNFYDSKNVGVHEKKKVLEVKNKRCQSAEKEKDIITQRNFDKKYSTVTSKRKKQKQNEEIMFLYNKKSIYLFKKQIINN